MTTKTASTRPSMLRSNDSVQLAQEKQDIGKIPVTPAFGLENKGAHANVCRVTDYFGAARTQHGSVISATFTVPHVLHNKGKYEWHTTIAWTGEISQSENDAEGVSIAPSSTTIAPDGHSRRNEDAHSDKVVFISSDAQKRLEMKLYQRNDRIIPVWLYEEAERREDGIELRDQSKWREYAEHDLYPLFHYKQRDPSDGGVERQRWEAYYKVNAAFADKICKNYKPGDVVLVHDYYLMLLPKMIRQQLPDVRIAFILQTPFPTSELIRCLDRRQELLEGILGADVVVFQAHIYAEHFANSCARSLKVVATGEKVCQDGRHVQLADIPTGINIQYILERAFSPTVEKRCQELSKAFAGKKIILGRDPMNSLSGLDKKLHAFERFLHDWPEWREKAVLLQMTNSATLAVGGKEEAEFSADINVFVSSINSRYGSLSHIPVHLVPLSPTQDEYFALLRQSDLALVTSVREGISTTALEYTICQRERHGKLILSEFSGTASAIDKAVVVNPWDTSAVAHEIQAALTVSGKQRELYHSALFRQIQEMSVERWASKLFDRIEATANDASEPDEPLELRG
ncbi:Trehalose-phosphatase [Beauveria bassiana]|nr:Trehalose-phosphatase [Beauveria bassiana]